MTRAELMPEIMKLSLEDRLRIADELLRSAQGEETDEDAALKQLCPPHYGKRETHAELTAELARRLDDAEKHPEDAVSWEDLSRELDNL